MTDKLHQELIDLKPRKEFFIGVDSDGCAFDTMEIKHKECFCPKTIMYWNLQIVSKYVREAWDFVNLYSKTRGVNRFKGLVRVMDLLRAREEVVKRGAVIPELTHIRNWIDKETKLGNAALEVYSKKIRSAEIDNALNWSNAINQSIAEMVHDLPPFPYVVKSLEKMAAHVDAIVVSQTPVEALKREWSEHEIDKFVLLIAGQEYGTKTEHLKYAAAGKYAPEKILMIGDAPGDMRAAKDNGVLFYPVLPGNEEESWQKFYEEAYDRFIAGTYAGKYEQGLIAEFDRVLPELPPWRNK